MREYSISGNAVHRRISQFEAVVTFDAKGVALLVASCNTLKTMNVFLLFLLERLPPKQPPLIELCMCCIGESRTTKIDVSSQQERDAITL